MESKLNKLELCLNALKQIHKMLKDELLKKETEIKNLEAQINLIKFTKENKN